jgi:hypothetical protein
MSGRQMTVGIRPEDLHVARDADPAGLTFNSKIEVVEQLGSEILLDVRVGDGTMVAAVEPTTRARVQDMVRLAVNPRGCTSSTPRPIWRSEAVRAADPGAPAKKEPLEATRQWSFSPQVPSRAPACVHRDVMRNQVVPWVRLSLRVLVAISDSASLRPKTVTVLFYVPLRVDQRLKASGFDAAIKTIVMTDDLVCSGTRVRASLSIEQPMQVGAVRPGELGSRDARGCPRTGATS